MRSTSHQELLANESDDEVSLVDLIEEQEKAAKNSKNNPFSAISIPPANFLDSSLTPLGLTNNLAASNSVDAKPGAEEFEDLYNGSAAPSSIGVEFGDDVEDADEDEDEEIFEHFELTDEQYLLWQEQERLAIKFDLVVDELCTHQPLYGPKFDSPDYFELINEMHFVDGVQIENHFVALTSSLVYLAKTVKDHNSPHEAQVFLDNATQLALEIATRHVMAKRSRSKSYYLHTYEYQLAALKDTVNNAAVFLKNPSELDYQQAFSHSISNLQNRFQARDERFLTERPLLSALITSSLILLGAGLIVVGILTAPLNAVTSICLMTSGSVLFSLGASLSLAMWSLRLSRPNDEVTFIRQASNTANDAKVLVKSPSTLFASRHKLPQIEVDPSLEETRSYSPTTMMGNMV